MARPQLGMASTHPNPSPVSVFGPHGVGPLPITHALVLYFVFLGSREDTAFVHWPTSS